jgi:uncharacterized spore protein YtfJ
MTTQAEFNTAPIEQMLAKLGVESLFGPPTKEGETTIIPVAQLAVGFGYGSGYGRGGEEPQAGAQEGQSTVKSGEGGGGGGGAGGRATPRGVLRITPQTVSFEPVFDPTRIPLAGILMVAWAIFWITATIRVIARAIASSKKK